MKLLFHTGNGNPFDYFSSKTLMDKSTFPKRKKFFPETHHMWILSKENDPSFKHVLLTNRVYTVGRSDSDIIILDRSVSRHHATLRVDYTESDLDAAALPSLSVVDLSKFGTSVNGQALNKSTRSLKSGAKITFGALPGVTVTADMQPLNVLLSSVSVDQKSAIRSHLLTLGATSLPAWDPMCTLVVMPRLIVTHKVLCALLCGVSVVTPAYLESLIDACGRQPFSRPNCADFLPQIEEKGFDESDRAKFYPNAKRSKVFDGKTFYFMTQSKFQRYRQLLSLTTASMELLTSSSTCIGGTQVRAALCNRLASTTACVVYESPATILYSNDQSWHAMVYAVLQELGLRPILEQEIAFAIIEASSASVCNPRTLCYDRLLNQSQGLPEDYLLQFARSTVPSTIATNSDCPPMRTARPSLLSRKRFAESPTNERYDTENKEQPLENPESFKKRRRTLQPGPISRLLPPDRPFHNTVAQRRSNILVPDTEALPASSILVLDNADTVGNLTSPGRQMADLPPSWSPGSQDLLEEEEEPDPKPTSANVSLRASLGGTSVTVASPSAATTTATQSIVTAAAAPKAALPKNQVDQAVLNAFDSLPSLSALIQWPTSKPAQECLGSDTSVEGKAHRPVKDRLSAKEPAMCYAEKENIPPSSRASPSAAVGSNSSRQNRRVSEHFATGGFLSKEQGQKLSLKGLTSSDKQQTSPEATVEPAIACAKVEFATLYPLRPPGIPKTAPSSGYGGSITANFKRFRKVWPLTCGSSCRDIYVELPAKQPPMCPRIALTPFVAGQKEDAMAAACRINVPSSPDAEDLANQAKINHLFDQLCALPTLKRR